MLFEAALGSLRSDSREPVETLGQELGERVRVAEELAALDLARESRVRESLRERLRQALEERRARPVAPAPRRPWVMRRPVLAAEIAVLVAVALLAVVAPRSLAALVEPVVRMIVIEMGLHRDEPVRFNHALVAPGDWVLVFFGSGPNELLLFQCPVGEGRSVGVGRSTSRRGPDGQVIVESPELKREEMSLGGRTVVWDPDPEPPARGRAVTSPGTGWRAKARSLFRPARSESSAPRWEKAA